MMIFGFLLVPMVLAAPSELTRNIYVPEIESGVLKSIEVIGEPPDIIDLSGLGFERIDANVFQNVTHVKSIILTNNSISSVPRSTFLHLSQLEHLSLAENAISSLELCQFCELSNLKFLNISNNPIRELTSGRLYGLGKSTNISVRLPHGLSKLSTLVFDKIDYDSRLPSICGGAPSIALSIVDRIIAKVCIRDGMVQKVVKSDVELHCKFGHILYGNFDPDLVNQTHLRILDFATGWHPYGGLDLNDKNITDISAEFLNDFPAHINKIDLSNNRIVRLKKEIIINEHLTSLNLTNNYISVIEDGALEKTSLSSVDLRKNQLNNTRFITTLPPTLQSLILSENCINELLPDVFSRFHKLDKIDFAGNNITVIKYESLRGLNSVKSLILARNNIENIEIGALRHLTSVENLDLANNKLTKLVKGVFDGLPDMHRLDLSSNNIKKITHDSFHGLRSVDALTLSFNQIEILEAGTFAKIRIYELYLNDNKIKKIENGAFDAAKLKYLFLQNNSLNQINGDEFAGLDYYEEWPNSPDMMLDLSNNGISKIEKGFAKYLGNVTELNLSDNPIERLENGALFGLSKTDLGIVRLDNVQLELLQGGVFDDL